MGVQGESGKRYTGRSDIEHYEHGAVADRSDGREFKKTQSVPNKLAVDVVDTSVTYLGETKPGLGTDEAFWRIRKIFTSGTVTTISFAGGQDSFTQVWDDRASLDYS
jgi:hypothetical protein